MSLEDRVVVVSRRRKTNSERGKEFRAKRKDHEQHLEQIIRSLRDEVEDLRFLRDIRRDQSLVTRGSAEGSLVKLVQEYFSLFARGRPTRLHAGGKRGSPSSAPDLLTRQANFVSKSMDEDLMFGPTVGTDALLDQWERYTLYHSSFQISIKSLEVVGPQESPIVSVTSHMSVKLSRETFKHIFPHVAHDEALVARLVGKQVTYKGVNQFEFSDDGQRILVYESDVDFVNAFLSAGISLADVTTLMQQAYIADQYLLGEEPLTPSRIEEITEDEDSPDEVDTEVARSTKQLKKQTERSHDEDRQRIEYLLN